MNTTLNSTTIQWVVAFIGDQQNYTVVYGTTEGNLEFSLDPITSAGSGMQTYAVTLEGLAQGTTYYVQIVSTFGVHILTSDIISFRTLEPGL